jgi:hypothetical protein
MVFMMMVILIMINMITLATFITMTMTKMMIIQSLITLRAYSREREKSFQRSVKDLMFHDSACSDFGLLGCDTVQFCRLLTRCRRNMLPPSSGSKSQPGRPQKTKGCNVAWPRLLI